MKFSVSHAADAAFERKGLRSFFEYRDLGILEATDGAVVAHVIRARPGKAPHGQWHRHDCDVQFVYVLKGWAEFEYAGVAQAAIRVYKVDLATLTIRRKGLADAAAIEVAGFKPVLERTVTLDHPNARRREKQKLAMDLKEPGAYLIGVKAGDFFASGLVLRSDLTMTVQEEEGGTVRVNGNERDIKAARALFLKLKPADRRSALAMLRDAD